MTVHQRHRHHSTPLTTRLFKPWSAARFANELLDAMTRGDVRWERMGRGTGGFYDTFEGTYKVGRRTRRVQVVSCMINHTISFQRGPSTSVFKLDHGPLIRETAVRTVLDREKHEVEVKRLQRLHLESEQRKASSLAQAVAA